MLRQFSTRRVIVFFLTDWAGTLVLLQVAGPLHDLLRHIPAWAEALPDAAASVSPGNFVLLPAVLIVALIWPLLLSTFSVYDGRRSETLKAELKNVFLAVCFSTMTLAGLLFFTYRETPRTLITLFFVLDVGFVMATRIVLWLFRRWQNGQVREHRQGVLIVGAGRVGRNVVKQLRKHAWADIDLIGFADDDQKKQARSLENLTVLGTLDQLPAIVSSRHIHAAVVALPLDAHERLLWTCKLLQSLNVRVYVIPDLFALSFPGAALDGFGGIPVIDLGQRGLNGWPRLVKRAFDIAGASVGIVLTSPLLLLIAVLIKLDSPGSILYKQERLGEGCRLFRMFKFRSMQANANPALHRALATRLIRENIRTNDPNGSLKLENDPRVTRVGRFLRKTSMDELPQLFNVLRGEMSLVGPRPPIPYEVELYQDWHKRRFETIPGITGLWQVKGRNRVSFDEMVRMDLEYIENQSLWLDLKLLIQTPLAVVSGKGAG